MVEYCRQRRRHPPSRRHASALAKLPPNPPNKSQNLHYLLKQSHHRLRPGRPQVAIAEQPGHGAASRRRRGGWTSHQIRCWRPAMILQGLQRRKAPLWLAHSIPSSMPARDGVMPTPSSHTDARNRPPRHRQDETQRAGESVGRERKWRLSGRSGGRRRAEGREGGWRWGGLRCCGRKWRQGGREMAMAEAHSVVS